MNWTSTMDLRSQLMALLEDRHPGMVTKLAVDLVGDVLILKGQVGSEACKGDAKRFALAFDGVFKVRNEIEVVGFLKPATDDGLDNYFSAAPPRPRTTRSLGMRKTSNRPKTVPSKPKRTTRTGDRGDVSGEVSVERHPAIELDGELTPGRRVDVVVDLRTEPSTASASPIEIGRFPADWEEIVVAVQLVAPWASEIAPHSPSVEIRADGSSAAARFECMVREDFDGESAQTQAVFTHGTRICGYLEVDLAAKSKDPTDASSDTARTPDEVRSLADPRSSEKLPIRVIPDAVGPAVGLTILNTGATVQTWTWTASLPGGHRNGFDTAELDSSVQEFARDLLVSCPTLPPERLGRVMDGIGDLLWRKSPRRFQDDYARWREELGTDFSIQINTNDPYIPWEMMKPEIPGARHLFIDHPLARWSVGRGGFLHAELGTGDRLSFVPNYKPHDALPNAEREGEWIVRTLGAIAMDPTIESFFQVLHGEHPKPVALIHFAGHGEASEGISRGGIRMQDGDVSLLEVGPKVSIGRDDRTFVILNACEVASSAKLLGMNVGWGAVLADLDFGGLLAPLWEVQDDVAFEMMKIALPPLLDGSQTLGEATRQARLVHHQSSPAAFAYVAHGDVMARFPV